MKNTQQPILNHPMVKIVVKDNQYIVLIRMLNKQYVATTPFPADQRGLVGAMMVATDILAGKIILDKPVMLNDDSGSPKLLPDMVELLVPPKTK